MTNRLEIKVQKRSDPISSKGRFGFSFKNGKVTTVREDCLAQPNLEVGDKILSINGHSSRRLVEYVQSDEAKSLQQWIVVIERWTASESSLSSLSSLPTDSSYMSLDQKLSFRIADMEDPLYAKALSKPESVYWSQPMTKQLNTSLFTIKSFKKKVSAQASWVLIKDIECHGSHVDLHKADCILSVNNISVNVNQPTSEILSFIYGPAPQQGASSNSASHGGWATFVISRPRNSPPSFAEPKLPTPPPLINPTEPSFPQPLQPPPLPPIDALNAPVERLGRYRVLVHDLDHVYDNDKFLHHFLPQLFGVSAETIEGYAEYSHVGHFDLHLNYQPDSDVQVDCVPPAEEQSCQYESLAVHQHLSLSAAMAASSTASCAQHVHIEVLCPYYRGNLMAWYSPVLYCKHSINVILINDISIQRQSLIKLSQLLRDICVHSGDVSGIQECSSKVMLLLFGAAAGRQQMIRRVIDEELKAYLYMLVCTNENDNSNMGNPFILMDELNSVSFARKILQSKLLFHMNLDAIQTRYVRLAMEIARQLRGRTNFISRGEIRHLVEAAADLPNGEPISLRKKALTIDSVLNYLHNIGLAYVPEISFSHVAQIGCPEMKHHIFLHPYQALQTVYQMLAPPSSDSINVQQWQRFHDHQLANEALLIELLNCDEAEKVIAFLKDLLIALPTSSDRGGSELLIPFLISFDRVPIPDTQPDLVLQYQYPQPFIFNVSLLHFLSQKADSSIVQYDDLCGRFFLHRAVIVVCLMSKAPQSALPRNDYPLAEQDKCFNIYILSYEESLASIAGHIKEMVREFYRVIKPKPFLGPLCPLGDCAETKNPIHVLNILKTRGCVFTCCGVDLTHVVERFVLDVQHSAPNAHHRQAARNKVLQSSARLIQPNYLQDLNKPCKFDNNWKRLAAELGYTADNIPIIEAEGKDNPTEFLMQEASSTYHLTVQDLLSYLVDMGRIDVVTSIGHWIDQVLEDD